MYSTDQELAEAEALERLPVMRIRGDQPAEFLTAAGWVPSRSTVRTDCRTCGSAKPCGC